MRQSVVAIVEAPDDLNAAMNAAAQGPARRPLAPISIVGSGFCVSRDGIIATAKHVIQPWIDAIAAAQSGAGAMPPMPKILIAGEAERHNDRTEWGFYVAPLQYLYWHNTIDIAIGQLAASPANALPLVPIDVSANSCEEGDDVAICGYPLGSHLHRDLLGGMVVRSSFSRGIVSAVLPFPGAPRELRELFQIHAMINRGNSGGPVFTMSTGHVVGIISSTSIQTYNVIMPNSAPGGGNTQGRIDVPTGLARGVEIRHVEQLLRTFRNSRAVPSPIPAAVPPAQP